MTNRMVNLCPVDVIEQGMKIGKGLKRAHAVINYEKSGKRKKLFLEPTSKQSIGETDDQNANTYFQFHIPKNTFDSVNNLFDLH